MVRKIDINKNGEWANSGWDREVVETMIYTITKYIRDAEPLAPDLKKYLYGIRKDLKKIREIQEK